MDSSTVNELLLLAILIGLNAFFAASEIAVISVPKLRLRQLIEGGNQTAAILYRLADDSSRFLATIQIGVTLMGFLASATAAVSLSGGLTTALMSLAIEPHTAQGIAVALITSVLAIVTLVLGELAPKQRRLRRCADRGCAFQDAHAILAVHPDVDLAVRAGWRS